MVQILRLRAKYALGFAVATGLTLSALPLLSRAKAKFTHSPAAFTVSPSNTHKLSEASSASATSDLVPDDLAPGSHANYNDYSAAANVNGYGRGATLVGTSYSSLKDTGSGSALSGGDAGSADHTLNGSFRESGTITVGATAQEYAALSHGNVAESTGGNSFGRSGAGIASSMVDLIDSDLANSDNASQGLDSATATSAANGIFGDPASAAYSGSQEISSVSDRQLRSSGAGSATVTTDDSANVIVTNTRGNTSSTLYGADASRGAGEFTPYGADIATNGSATGSGIVSSGDGSGSSTSSPGNGPAGGQLATTAGTTHGSVSGGGLLAVNTGGSQGSGGPFAGGGAGGSFGSIGSGDGGTSINGIPGAGTSLGGRPDSGDKREPLGGGGDIYNGPAGQPTSSPSGDPLGATAAPEPGIIVTALSLVGMTGLGLVRGRRRAKHT